MRKNYFSLLFFSILCISEAFCQEKYKFERFIGASGLHLYEPISATVDEHDTIYIANSGGSEIIKIDREGKIHQRFRTPTSGGENKTGFLVDKKGNIYISDYYSNTIRKYSSAALLLMQFNLLGQVGDYSLPNPSGMALDSEENIYIVDQNNNRIVKHDSKGNFVQTFGSYGSGNGQFDRPIDVTIDQEGNLYIADAGNSRVQKIDKRGNFLFKFGSYGYSKGLFNRLTGLAVDNNGNIYALDGGSNAEARIQKFDNSGSFLLRFESPEWSDTHFNFPYSLQLDRNGNVFVADTRNSRILKFSPSGSLLRTYGVGGGGKDQFSKPNGVALDTKGNIYVVDSYANRIQKFDKSGQFMYKITSNEAGVGSIGSPQGIAVDSLGHIYVTNGEYNPQVMKFDRFGKPLLTFGSFGSEQGQFKSPKGIGIDAVGNVFVADFYNYRIQKFTRRGDFLLSFGSYGEEDGQFHHPTAVKADVEGNIYVADGNTYQVKKFDKRGNFLLKFGSFGYGPGQFGGIADLAIDNQGYIYVVDFYTNRIQKFDQKGNFLLQIGSEGSEEGQFNKPTGIAINSNGSKIIIADSDNSRIQVFSNGNEPLPSPQNIVTGKVFRDQNQNCQQDKEDLPLVDVLIVAEPGPYYTFSDSSGNYSLRLDTGAYAIRQAFDDEINRVITPVCPTNTFLHKVDLKNYGNKVVNQDFANQVVLLPYLTTNVSSNRRRRCFTNETTISYVNSGLAAAENVQVHFKLPKYVVLQSANQPFTIEKDSVYVFAIGTLAANQRGSISIKDSVICGNSEIRGLTVCTNAWITPMNSSPVPPNPNWDKSDITLESECRENGFVRLTIKNSGAGNMADSLSFRIFLDAQLALQHSFQISKGDSLILTVPANGKTVRMEVDQHPDHPRKKQASITIEGCGTNAKGAISTGFVNALPADDAEPEVAVDCQPITDSFDPNDKAVQPTGLMAEKYTPTKTELKYRIRFQNTGNDLAYTVVVVDTLSEQLDIASLKVGAVSHPYTYTITGKGRPIITWRFDDINLPDSARNQAGSNGYIQFSIKPKSDLPEKTRIENFADIFFDYNEPVRTNTTLNTLYDLPLQVVPAIQLNPEKVIRTPKVSAFSPLQGRPGIIVIVTGQNFSGIAANNSIKFNGKQTTVLAATATSLTVRIPEGASTGKVSVQTPDGSCQSIDDFIVFLSPTLSDFTPKESKAAESLIITLTGTHFSSDPLQDTVYFNSAMAKVLSATATKLTVEVPANATTGNIRINSLGGSVQSAESFVIWQLPTISLLSAETGTVGSTLTIMGQNFAENSARNTVLFGEVRAEVLQASSTVLRVKVPVGAQTNWIRVQTPGGVATSSSEFIVIPAPVLTDFTPKQGSTGAVVTLEGTHFNVNNQSDTVRFNGLVAKVLKATATQLTVWVPFGAQSGQITVDGLGGQGKSREYFTVVQLSLEDAIQVYPNPADGKFLIDATKADFVVQQVRVYTMLGAQVFTKQLSGPQENPVLVELSSIAHGMYLVVLQTEKGLVFRKIALR